MDNCNYVKVESHDDAEIVHTGKPVLPPVRATLSHKNDKRKSRGTCCNVCLCLGGFLFGLGFLLIFATYMYASQAVRLLTVEHNPDLELDTVTVPENELTAFKYGAEAFFDNLEERNKVGVTNELTATEKNLNGLASASDFLRGHVRARLYDDEVELDVSFPTDVFPGGKGRLFVAQLSGLWRKEDSTLRTSARVFSEKTVGEAFSRKPSFNAEDVATAQATIHVGRTNDRLAVTYKDGYSEVLGWFLPLPDEELEVLSFLYDSDDEDAQDAARVLNTIENISLEKGKITVQATN